MVFLARQYNIGMELLNKIWSNGPRGIQPGNPDTDLSTRKADSIRRYESLLHNSKKICSYLIDRVYSLVGLTSARIDGRFAIDYHRGIRQVFIDAAQYTIATDKALSIICASQPVPGSRDL